ncbi:unnamed protein product, partial [Coregonus sp. 'balchen']
EVQCRRAVDSQLVTSLFRDGISLGDTGQTTTPRKPAALDEIKLKSPTIKEERLEEAWDNHDQRERLSTGALNHSVDGGERHSNIETEAAQPISKQENASSCKWVSGETDNNENLSVNKRSQTPALEDGDGILDHAGFDCMMFEPPRQLGTLSTQGPGADLPECSYSHVDVVPIHSDSENGFPFSMYKVSHSITEHKQPVAYRDNRQRAPLPSDEPHMTVRKGIETGSSALVMMDGWVSHDSHNNDAVNYNRDGTAAHCVESCLRTQIQVFTQEKYPPSAYSLGRSLLRNTTLHFTYRETILLAQVLEIPVGKELNNFCSDGEHPSKEDEDSVKQSYAVMKYMVKEMGSVESGADEDQRDVIGHTQTDSLFEDNDPHINADQERERTIQKFQHTKVAHCVRRQGYSGLWTPRSTETDSEDPACSYSEEISPTRVKAHTKQQQTSLAEESTLFAVESHNVKPVAAILDSEPYEAKYQSSSSDNDYYDNDSSKNSMSYEASENFGNLAERCFSNSQVNMRGNTARLKVGIVQRYIAGHKMQHRVGKREKRFVCEVQCRRAVDSQLVTSLFRDGKSSGDTGQTTTPRKLVDYSQLYLASQPCVQQPAALDEIKPKSPTIKEERLEEAWDNYDQRERLSTGALNHSVDGGERHSNIETEAAQPISKQENASSYIWVSGETDNSLLPESNENLSVNKRSQTPALEDGDGILDHAGFDCMMFEPPRQLGTLSTQGPGADLPECSYSHVDVVPIHSDSENGFPFSMNKVSRSITEHKQPVAYRDNRQRAPLPSDEPHMTVRKGIETGSSALVMMDGWVSHDSHNNDAVNYNRDGTAVEK